MVKAGKILGTVCRLQTGEGGTSLVGGVCTSLGNSGTGMGQVWSTGRICSLFWGHESRMVFTGEHSPLI